MYRTVLAVAAILAFQQRTKQKQCIERTAQKAYNTSSNVVLLVKTLHVLECDKDTQATILTEISIVSTAVNLKKESKDILFLPTTIVLR